MPIQWKTWRNRQFLRNVQPSKTDQEEIANTNRPSTGTEIETVIKNLLTNKSPGLDSFTCEFYQTVREELTPIFLKLFQNVAEGGTLLSSCYKATVTLIPKQRYYKKRNYRPISLIIIDAKVLNKILTNRMQQHIKRIIHRDQGGLSQECKDPSIYAIQSMSYTILTN